jgi:DNA-binding GntR family transcriptional regulator
MKDETIPRPDVSRRIERRALYEQLADQLREMILSGDLAPGERLQEIELSERFGVSRTPLREALKVLSSEGLIKLATNRGATVTELEPREVAEIFPVMGALEALAGELACAHATDHEIAELGRLHDELMAHYANRDQAAFFTTNRGFHTLLVEMARNETLAQHYSQLAGRVSRERYRTRMTDAQWAKSVSEHEALIAALRARDGSRAGKILRAHVDTKLETVRGALI